VSNTPNSVDLSEVLDQMRLYPNKSRPVQTITWTILILNMWQQTWIDSSEALFFYACNMTFHIVIEPCSTHEIVMVFSIKWLGAGSRQYCRYTKSPGYTPLLKEIWESSEAKENLALVGFVPTTSRLDLPLLYRVSSLCSGLCFKLLWLILPVLGGALLISQCQEYPRDIIPPP